MDVDSTPRSGMSGGTAATVAQAGLWARRSKSRRRHHTPAEVTLTPQHSDFGRCFGRLSGWAHPTALSALQTAEMTTTASPSARSRGPTWHSTGVAGAAQMSARTRQRTVVGVAAIGPGPRRLGTLVMRRFGCAVMSGAGAAARGLPRRWSRGEARGPVSGGGCHEQLAQVAGAGLRPRGYRRRR